MTLFAATRIDGQAVREPQDEGRRTLWAVVTRVLGWPVRVHRARQMMVPLSRMNDRELHDIGLTRQDLHDTATLDLDADPSRLLRRRVEDRRRR